MAESLIVRPYHWSEEDTSRGVQIRLWAFNRKSERVLITLMGFQTSLYIRLPLTHNGRKVSWNRGTVGRFMEEVGKHAYGLDYKWKFETHNKVTEFTDNKPIPVVLVTFSSLEARRQFGYRVNKNKKYGAFGMYTLNILEKDISAVKRLTSIMDIEFTSWLTVNSMITPLDSKISDLTLEYRGDWKSLKQMDNSICGEWVLHPATMIIDIECHSNSLKGFPVASNEFDSMHMISCVFQELGLEETTKTYIITMNECNDTDRFENLVIIRVENEVQIVDELFKLLKSTNTIMVSGYNMFKFDWPYIYDRMSMIEQKLPQLSPLRRKQTGIYEKNWSSSAYGEVRIIKPDSEGVIYIDLFLVISRDYKLRKYSLNYVSDHFLGDQKDDMPAKEMFRIFHEQKLSLTIGTLMDEFEETPQCSDSKMRHLSKKIHAIHPQVYEHDIYDMMVDRTFSDKFNVIYEDRLAKSRIEMTRFIEYCVIDSLLPIKLFNKLSCFENIMGSAAICSLNPEVIYMSGQQIGTYSLLYRFGHKQNILLQKMVYEDEGKFKGGHVNKPVAGYHTKVTTLDFNSLYPSIMIANNLCYTTIIPAEFIRFIKKDRYRTILLPNDEKVYVMKQDEYIGFVPDVLKKLLSDRKSVRRPVKQLEKDLDEALLSINDIITRKIRFNLATIDSRQKGLKIVCNSVYGFMGASLEKGIMPYKIIGKATCCIGRGLILGVADHVEKTYPGCKIVYGDTDSVMVKIEAETCEEAMVIALDMEDDFNGVDPGCEDHRGKVYPEGRPGRFLPGLRIEVERLMEKVVFIKPKMYCYIPFKKEGTNTEKITDYLGTRTRPRMEMKGVPPAKKGTPPFLSMLYCAVCEIIFKGGDYIICLQLIERFLTELINRRVTLDHLSKVAKVGGSYKKANYELALFTAGLHRRERPVSPGDRLEYVVVEKDKTQGKVYKGDKMYMIEEIMENPNLIPDISYYMSSFNTVDTVLEIVFGDYIKSKSPFIVKIGQKKLHLKRGITKCMAILYDEGYDITSVRQLLQEYNKVY